MHSPVIITYFFLSKHILIRDLHGNGGGGKINTGLMNEFIKKKIIIKNNPVEKNGYW